MATRPMPYGDTVMEHFRRPRNQGRLAAPDGVREGANPLCGDRVRIELAVHDGRVAEARFTANACAICVAAASVLTEQARGMPTGAVRAITSQAILDELGGAIPEARRVCAILPLTTLIAALDAAQESAPKQPQRGTPDHAPD